MYKVRGVILCGSVDRPSSTYVWCLYDIGRDSWDREKSEVDETKNKTPPKRGEEALAEWIHVAFFETECPHV